MFLLLDCYTQWCHILLFSDALLKFLNPTPGPSTAVATTSATQSTSDAAESSTPPVATTSATQSTTFPQLTKRRAAAAMSNPEYYSDP